MSVLSMFKGTTKSKPFDLPTFLASWPEAPIFLGKPKKDKLNVEQWLDAIAAGCTERGVEQKHWPSVARALLGEKALGRLEEFERVLVTMQNGKEVSWTWERFRVALPSMGWEISNKRTHAFTVAAQRCGKWWVMGRKREGSTSENATPSAAPTAAPARPEPKRKGSLFQRVTGGSVSEEPEAWDVLEESKPKKAAPPSAANGDGTVPVRKTPVRAMSDTFTAAFRVAKVPSSDSIDEKEKTDASSTAVVASAVKPPVKRANTEPVATTVTQAPEWLLGAQGALEHLTSEYPKAMTTIAAILVTAGSIPALAASGGTAAFAPLLAASHGGQAAIALLSAPAAQAAGAIALGLGNWIKAQQQGQITVTQPTAPAIKAA